MKICITGAGGFIGAALSEHMAACGHVIVPIARRSSKVPNGCVMSAGRDAEWDSLLSGCESVIHLAGRAHVMKETATDPLQAFRAANVDISAALARRAVVAGVKRFVFISTVKVNGEQTGFGDAFVPDDLPAPEDAYAISKWEAERSLREIAAGTGLEVTIIRPTLVYGPGVKGNFATLVQWVRRGVPLPLGAVNNQRSLIGLENLVDFIARCADPVATPQAANQVFLVSDGKPVSTTELLQKIAAAYGARPWLVPVPGGLIRLCAALFGKSAVADRLLGSLVVDDSKAREMLGWRPPLSMEEQLRRMASVADVE